MTLLDDPRPISADSHVVEGPAVFDGLADHFGDDAPRVVSTEGKGDTILIPSSPKRAVNVAVMALAATRLDYEGGVTDRRHGHKPGTGSIDDPEIQAYFTGGYAAMRPGLTDGARRGEDQDVDGLSAEVLYPGYFTMFGMKNTELQIALQRQYNDWMHETCEASQGRLIGLAVLPVADPDAAIAEFDRVAAMGYRGVMVPSNAPRGRNWSDPEYEPLWARAEEAGLPVSFHVGCLSHIPDWMKATRGRDPIAAYSATSALIYDTLVDLMCRGVCQRHPNLRFVAAEFNAGWLAHWLDRVNQGWAREFARDPQSARPEPVEEIWARQFYATIEDDQAALRTRDLFGEDTLMWGSDYPHTDSTWPCSVDVLAEMFEDYPADTKDKITRRTVAELYRL